MDSALRQITLFELEILSELARHPSFRAVCRAKKLEPSHLSKILLRLESKLGVTLVKRSPKGFLLTPDGLRLVKLSSEILVTSEGLGDRRRVGDEPAPKLVTIAASRFVTTHLVAPSVDGLKGDSTTQFRLLDMAPDEVASAALRSVCEAVVTVDEPSLSRSWHTVRVGYLTWALYASRRHPLTARASAERVAEYPFLVPTYWTGEGYETGDDYCPMPWSKRLHGDETSSVITAVEILKRSPDQLLFAPRLVTAENVRSGDLKEIKVTSWERVRKEVFLSVHSDRVSKSFQEKILAVLADRIS